MASKARRAAISPHCPGNNLLYLTCLQH